MSEKVFQFIQDYYEQKKEKNPKYSMRSFAHQLEVEPSMLAKILNKKRALTFETANKILDKINIQTSLRNSLLLSFSDANNYYKAVSDDQLIKLNDREAEIQYKWYFFAVLGVIDTDEIEGSVKAISSYLNLDQAIVQEAIDVLKKLEAIEEYKVDIYKTTRKSFTINQGENTQVALAQSYIHYLNQSIQKIESEDEAGSEFTGTTFAIPTSKLDEARRRIIEFNRSMASWLTKTDGSKSDVYRLSIQFFPLGKKD